MQLLTNSPGDHAGIWGIEKKRKGPAKPQATPQPHQKEEKTNKQPSSETLSFKFLFLRTKRVRQQEMR
jgi:hypothetical protein